MSAFGDLDGDDGRGWNIHAGPFGKDVSMRTEGQTVRLFLSPIQSSSVQRLGLYFDAQSYRLTRILVKRNGAQTVIHLQEWKEGIPCTQRGLGERDTKPLEYAR